MACLSPAQSFFIFCPFVSFSPSNMGDALCARWALPCLQKSPHEHALKVAVCVSAHRQHVSQLQQALPARFFSAVVFANTLPQLPARNSAKGVVSCRRWRGMTHLHAGFLELFRRRPKVEVQPQNLLEIRAAVAVSLDPAAACNAAFPIRAWVSSHSYFPALGKIPGIGLLQKWFLPCTLVAPPRSYPTDLPLRHADATGICWQRTK